MRDKVLRKLAYWHANYPWRILLISLVITAILGYFSGKLELRMHLSDLMPEGNEKVEEFDKIIEEFSTATSLFIVLQGEEEQMKDFADAFAPRLLELRDDTRNEKFQNQLDELQTELEQIEGDRSNQLNIIELKKLIKTTKSKINKILFKRIDYKVEEDFIRENMLKLIKAEDLVNTKDYFMNPNLVGLLTNLNNSMEKEYVGKEESISTREKENGAVSFLDGIHSLTQKIMESAQDGSLNSVDAKNSVDRLLFGDPYMISQDKDCMIMIAIPTFTIMDRDYLVIAASKAQEELDNLLVEYPGLSAGLSGAIAREHDEAVYAKKSMNISSLVAFVVILILLIVVFRMWLSPVFAILTLVIGVIWAMGLSYLVIGNLNMMTAMMSVILIGLGIDFAIHIISAFTENRANGDNIHHSLQNTYSQSAKGIITGAFTTSCAFITLIISQTQGMRELGIVIAIGLVSILLSTMFFLPTLLVLRERRIIKKMERKNKISLLPKGNISFGFLGKTSEWLGRKYRFTLAATIIVTFLLAWSAFNIKYDYNYMNLEPEGLESIALMDTVMNKFDMNMESTIFLANSIEQSREYAEQSKDLNSVGLTDDISAYLPSVLEQEERAPHIEDIYNNISRTKIENRVLERDLPKLIEEIERLEMNIIEMQDMAFLGGQDKVDKKCSDLVGIPEQSDSPNLIKGLYRFIENSNSNILDGLTDFQNNFAPHFRERVINMCSTEKIELSDLPETILDRYANKDQDLFLVTVYPSGDLWREKEFLERFDEDMNNITPKATGMASLFVSLIDIFGRDGRNAIMLTIVLVFLLLWLDFRKVSEALIAMLPLACGIFWMVGIIHAFGLMLNMVNMIGLPLIIGIGIDDGVHLVHRWKHEGGNQLYRIFASTGKAILLTSITTMFAFGSLGFSSFQGWASFGITLFIGVGACFLTSVIVLSGIMGYVDKHRNKRRVKES